MGKSSLLIAFLLSGTCLCHAQQWFELPTSTPVMVEKVLVTDDVNTLFLPMSFAQHQWSSVVKEKLTGKQILSISLVYTKFKTAESFDQIRLNESRLQRLRETLPELFVSDEPEWILIEQTGANSRETGRSYFHGFIIQTRAVSSEASREAELSELDDLKTALTVEPGSVDISSTGMESASGLDPDTTESPAKAGKTASYFMEESQIRTLDMPASFVGGNKALTEFLLANLDYPEADLKNGVEGTVLIGFTVSPDGSLTGIRTLNSVSPEIDKESIRVMKLSPKWNPAVDDGKEVASNYTIPIQFDADGDGRTPSAKSHKTLKTLDYVPFGKDEVVNAVLDRNQWHRMAIICDLTGSMSPYTKQLLRWFSTNINNHKVHSFTFFNDGDGMPDRKKKIGEVGGIYHTQTQDIAELIGLAKQVMRNGDGDDIPENNLEAAIEAQGKCNDCDLIMIADNFATPRDLRLVGELKSPVHVILCGASPFLNTSYLQLAYDTGGSLHTLYKDIGDMANLPNGSFIDFGVFRYRLNNGRFSKEPSP